MALPEGRCRCLPLFPLATWYDTPAMITGVVAVAEVEVVTGIVAKAYVTTVLDGLCASGIGSDDW